MDGAIQEFKQYLKRRYPDRSTAKHYINDLQHFQKVIDKPPRAVTHQDVDAFIDHQLAQGHKATTINRRLAALQHFFEFLADQADDDSWANPVSWHWHRAAEGKPLPRDVSDAHIAQLWEQIDHPRDRLMFDLMYALGLRVGEVAALNLSDFIPPGLPGDTARLRIHGKGHKERIVPLTADLVQEWEAWLVERPVVADEAVFITRRKSGISVRGIQDRLQHYCQLAGVTVSCHQLRHTFGRRMAEGKMPILSLAKLMGHAQVTTTQGYIAGAAVDVRADYEAALNCLAAERPGSAALPPTPLTPNPSVPIPPLGTSPDADTRVRTDDSSPEPALPWEPDWAGLPLWLAESLTAYLTHLRPTWKPSQRDHHTRARWYTLRAIWQWLVTEREVTGFAALGRRDVQAYLDARLTAGRSASTVNREMRDLYAFLRFVERQGTTISPGIFRVANVKESKPLPRFLTENDYQRLEEHLQEETRSGTRDDFLDRAWFYLLAHGGLRLGEVCDLRTGDVDLTGKRIMVREGKGKRDRAVPLSEVAVTALQDYLTVRGASATDHLLLFRQQPVKPDFIQRRLSQYGDAVAVKVSPHRLRHTLATRLVNAGMEITSIQKLLGHEKLTTTMIYAQVHNATVEQDFHRAMACLDAKRTSQPLSISLAEELFSHKMEPVHAQEPNCV